MKDQTPPNHTKLVVVCVTILGTQAALMGAFLLWKGFAGGGELVITLNSAISGLIGFLGGRASTATAQQSPPDITISSQPPKVEMTQSPEKKEEP